MGLSIFGAAMDVAARYEITLDQTDLAKGWQAMHDLAWQLHGEISKPVDSTEKVVPLFDQVAAKNVTAKADVGERISEVIEMLATFIDESPDRSYWLSEMFKRASSFVTSEVQYARRKAEKSIPVSQRSNAADVKRADIKTLNTIVEMFYSNIPGLAAEVDCKTDDKGNVKLPSVRVRTATDIPTSGRHVKAYYITFTVDDETFPAGTDPMEVVREIFTGHDRVGRKISDLWDPLDKLGVSKLKPGEMVETEINGKRITATMTEVETKPTE